MAGKFNIDSTPTGNNHFLGQFADDSVTLNLTGIAAHTQLTIDFDLYVIRSWDGTDATWGPDSVTFYIDDALVGCTTFANNPEMFQQWNGSFSGNCNAGPRAPGTGGACNTLGFTWYAPFADPMDCVYHFTIPFSHTAAMFKLGLMGRHLQPLIDESWGIDNVSVVISG